MNAFLHPHAFFFFQEVAARGWGSERADGEHECGKECPPNVHSSAKEPFEDLSNVNEPVPFQTCYRKT